MSSNTSKRGESFGISRIGNKIKGVFKSTTMEGAMLPSYGLAEGEDDMVSKLCLEIVFFFLKDMLISPYVYETVIESSGTILSLWKLLLQLLIDYLLVFPSSTT